MPTAGLRDATGKPLGSLASQQPQVQPQPRTPERRDTGGPMQAPGNNLVNPGYAEQAFEYTQNRLLDDPYAGVISSAAQQAGTAQKGENYMNTNLGALNGPGMGDQYWSQVGGQFNSPFSGEQYARQATQDFDASGPASAFYNQAQGQYGAMTGYSGPQNAQGQYGQSSGQLAGGTQGEAGLGQIAGQYGNIGQYQGQNLAAGQYAQTQGAFGDMPIANFDPFYDRARQLATQDYNRQSAGRGVYGSSEALSGVGNVITDIEAQRANRSFDAEMQRAQEQRMRQQLLGEQARMGDLSGTDAFSANLKGAETFGNINNQMGQLELDRHKTLGEMASSADTQALGAQNANIAGLSAFGTIANNADTAETDRYEATTSAMNQADQTGLERLKSGADIAYKSDENNRLDFEASSRNANEAAKLGLERQRTAADIANMGSDNDLARLGSFMDSANVAESARQSRQLSRLAETGAMSRDMASTLANGFEAFYAGNQKAWEDTFNSTLLPKMQAAGWSQQQIDAALKNPEMAMQAAMMIDMGGDDDTAAPITPPPAAAPVSRQPKRSLEQNPYTN